MNSGGNILTTDWDGKAPNGKFGGVPVEVKWISNDQLLIRYPKEAMTFTKGIGFEKITIEYETFDERQPPTGSAAQLWAMPLPSAAQTIAVRRKSEDYDNEQ